MQQTTGLAQIIDTLCSDPGYLLGAIAIILGIVGVTAISMTAMISDAWRKTRVNEELANLKLQMLARGMSAEEVVKVVSAGTPSRWARKHQRWCEHEFKQQGGGRAAPVAR